MTSQNENQSQSGPGKLPPPSFTPAAGRPTRPARTPAIEVGSPDTGPQTVKHETNEPGTSTNSQPIVTPRRPVSRPAASQQSGHGEPVRRSASSARPGVPVERKENQPRVASSQFVNEDAGGISHPESVPPSISPTRARQMPAPQSQGTTSPRRISGGGAPNRADVSQSSAHQPAPRTASSRPMNSSQHGASGPSSQSRPQGTAGLQGNAGSQRAPLAGNTGSALRPGAPGDGSGPRISAPVQSKPKRSRKKVVALTALVLALLLIAWPVGLIVWANGKINHIDALSGAANTPGTTYLIAGSDQRTNEDSTVEGARTDTIMLLHVPEQGPSALISLPRDLYVPIPGHDANKINAAYSWGGPTLLVQTVEDLTGMTVDHYVEIGFAGVKELVNAVGGVNLCLDYDVNDKESKLKWTAGCHDVQGSKALAFARMRKADPLGDIGRAQRQRQVVSAVAKKLQSPTQLINPKTQVSLISAGTSAVVVSEGTSIIDLGKFALAFRDASSKGGVTGTPPISSLNYRPGGVGSAVQLDEEAAPAFFEAVANGTLEPGEHNKLK